MIVASVVKPRATEKNHDQSGLIVRAVDALEAEVDWYLAAESHTMNL